MARKYLSSTLVCAAFLLLMAGCKESLHRGLTEIEANEVFALLDMNGVDAGRKYNVAEGNYDIVVEAAQISRAVTLLRANNLPREKFTTMGEVFAGQGFVSTPFEEKARYIYAVNQELSQSLSMIDGVARARVHVVIPEPNRITQIAEPARATIFIYYQDRFNLEASAPDMKTAVASSVDQLNYENVTLAAFPENTSRQSPVVGPPE